METWSGVDLSELVERRYLGLVELVRLVSDARDWKQLASAVSVGLERACTDPAEEPPAVRVWLITADGFEEAARFPSYHDFARCPSRALRRAARELEPVDTTSGGVLVGLQEGGVFLGAIEIDDPSIDAALLVHAAPVIGSRVGMLAGQGVGDILLAPVAVDGASDVGSLMSAFAAEAKRQLSHDRLSAYLLTNQGRAFERFAVATSPIVPGEGVVIPFEDVGLRHVVITDRALVSPDLATDPRVVGREDRVIAAAGFHGLLSVPLRVQGRPIGVLNFVSRTPAFYRDEDISIAQQIADQVAAFLENLHLQQRMRALISHEAAERERTRIGRDIYHVVAQNVPSIARIAAELEAATAPADTATRRQLTRVRELASGTLADVRRAIADLLPRDLDAVALDEGVRVTLGQLGKAEPKPRLKVVGDTGSISPAARRAAWRIVQEAVTNVRLHAAASTVTVSIECDRDLRLSVTDDGRGFDPEAVGDSGGMGLDHMRERARALGGVVEIESHVGKGTEIRFELLGVSDAADRPPSQPEFESATPAIPHHRVFVIDRHPLMRAGLLQLAQAADDLRVVGDAANVADARAQLRRLRPDVLLLDGHLPAAETEPLVRELRGELPLLRIVVTFESTTGHEAALADAGVSRFLRKTAGASELAEVIRSAANGNDVPHELPIPVEHGLLSPRERSILLLMSAGRTNTEIGKNLFLATKTVERQVATIVNKLGARNRAHAAALAAARRIVDPQQAD